MHKMLTEIIFETSGMIFAVHGNLRNCFLAWKKKDFKAMMGFEPMTSTNLVYCSVVHTFNTLEIIFIRDFLKMQLQEIG